MRRRELLAGAVAALGTSALRAAEPQPVWSEALQREAHSILDGAASDGLDPADYREGPVEAAFARYLHDLHLGRVRARDLGFGVTVPAQDAALVTQALQDGVAAGRLASAVERLTPPLAQYRQLREMLARYRRLASGPAPGTLKEQLVAFGDLAPEADVTDDAVKRFQARLGLEADGVIGRATLAALNVPPARRVRQIELAMERLRWLPRRGRWARRVRRLLLRAGRVRPVGGWAHARLLGLGALRHLLGAAAFLAFAAAAGAEIGLAPALWTRGVTGITMLLPLSVAGLGLRELSYVALLGIFGVPPATALAVSLMVFATLLLNAAAGGVIELGGAVRPAASGTAPDRR